MKNHSAEKQARIDEARRHYETRSERRPLQVWRRSVPSSYGDSIPFMKGERGAFAIKLPR